MAPHQSLWLAQDLPQIPFSPLAPHYDVVIIGAGITGAMTAYYLLDSDLSVAVIESRSIFSGVTGNTTGKLTAQHGLIFDKLIHTFGRDTAQLYAQANQWAVQQVLGISEEMGIDCDFATENAHIYTTHPDTWEDYEKEQIACAKLGLPTELLAVDLPFGKVNAIRMRDQARFHPVKFLRQILAAAQGKGMHVSEGVRALEVEETKGGVEITTNQGKIQADRVVVATHYPIHDSGWFSVKLSPYRSYAMALRLNTPALDGMYITEDEPMHSLRKHVDETGEYQVVGGGNHKVGQDPATRQQYAELEAWALKNFDIRDIAYRWSTQDNWTPDGLPYIGKSPHRDRIWVATGFAGWGMSNGVVAGRLIADQILERDNPWTKVYDPSRMELAAVPTIVKENLNVAKRYYGDRISRADYETLAEVPVGGAGIVQLLEERVAVYKDEAGETHAVASACTHLGCQVAWNEAEMSWDCPCHGSRFAPDGTVLHGPATKPLAKHEGPVQAVKS